MTPLIEAHRGDSSNAPENTLSAFERAIRLAVPWMELDVRPARDGTPMVIHDDTVDRTTNGSGAVSELTVDELLRLDAGTKFSPAHAGEGIPRFVDVLDMVAPTASRLNVEIKSPPHGAGLARTVVDLLRQFGKQREYTVSSFDLHALATIRTMAPEITLALIGDGAEILTHAERLHLPWIHGNHTTVSKEIVARAHAQGIRVNVWTVDTPETYPLWRATGVDKLCTNRPELMLAAAGNEKGKATSIAGPKRNGHPA